MPIATGSHYYTTKLHIAGKGLAEAEWTAQKFRQAGWDSSGLATYNVFINYPVSKSLTVSYPDGSVFEPDLEEAELSMIALYYRATVFRY